MPPLYDNIVDALALTQDGTLHTVDLDNTGATLETNEATYGETYPSIWVKFDLTDPAYSLLYGTSWVTVHFESVADGGSSILPYLDIWYDPTNTFDPSSPDFSLLTTPGGFVGDGTSAPPALDNNYQPGFVYYVFVGDWSGTNSGGQTITYNIPLAPATYDVDVSDYNNTSGTVSVPSAGTIRETQPTNNNYSVDGRGAIDSVYTFKVPTAQLPPDGRYQVYLKGQIRAASAWTGFNSWWVLVRRNGEPLFPSSFLYAQPAGGNPSANDLWLLSGEPNGFGGIVSGFSKYYQGHGPTTTPVLAGDEISFAVYSDDPNNLTGSPVKQFDITGATFLQIEAGGHAQSINLATVDRDPTTWSTDGRDDPTNESTIDQKDMCVLNNGDIYVFYKAHKTATAQQYLKLRKYSGGAWTTISTDVSAAGNGPGWTAGSYGQISMDTDGTNLYLVWGEPDLTTSKTLTRSNGTTASFHPMLWHCKKYVPGTGFTQLGTGQCKIPIASRTKAATVGPYVPDAGDYDTSIKIKVAPNGVPWVVWGETEDAFYGSSVPPSSTNTRVYVAYWDGSTWQETGFPDHPNWSTTDNQGAYLDFIDVDAQHDIDLTFCHHNGPSNYPSVIYSLGSFDTGRGNINQRFIYREFDGTSWGNLINTIPQEIWPNATLVERDFPTFTGGAGQQGMALENDGVVPIFAAALWTSHYSDLIKVAKVKTDGSALEEYSGTNKLRRSADTGWYRDDSSIISGGWFDPTGCDMAIGPDGKPWVIYTGTEFDEYGLQLFRFGEYGTDDCWIISSRTNGMLLGEDAVGFARIKIVGSNIYVLGLFDKYTGISGIERLAVYKAPINDSYNAWASGPGATSILAYHKDGVWHQANSETTRDLYYFKSGSWHKKDAGLKAVHGGTWTD